MLIVPNAMQPHTNLGFVAFDDLTDGVSKMSMEPELEAISCEQETVGYRSLICGADNGQVNEDGCSTNMGLPYLLIGWHDRNARSRISLQMHLPSSDMIHKTLRVCISTDQMHVVVSYPVPLYFEAGATNAFYSYLRKQTEIVKAFKTVNDLKYILDLHPRTIAQKRVISHLCERTPSKQVTYTQRIALGHPVHRKLADKIDDEFFHGKKIIKYPDGSVHLLLELICDSKDWYSVKERDEYVVDMGEIGEAAVAGEFEVLVDGSIADRTHTKRPRGEGGDNTNDMN